MPPLRYLFLAGVLLSFAAVSLAPVNAFAQSGEGSSTANAASTSDAAILQELERMRLRIQELEEQLKQRGPGAQPTPAASQPGMPGTALVGTAHVGDSSPAMQPASVSTSPDAVVVQQSSQPAAENKGQPAATEPAAPFAFADWTWLNGNPRTKKPAFDSEFFTPEIRADVNYTYSFNHPADDTIGGSSEIFRSAEFQLEQLGVGGDFHYDNVQVRLMTQFGMYSATTPRNDASPARGNWDLDTAYRYLAEAYGGYHINALHGINLQAGIFMSYVGLFSYYNFDNWAYQPSYVSSNTPWFFNGMRVQIFPTEKLKIEPWLINGWQSYGRFNNRPGVGGQILWRPTGWLSILGNQYALGEDTLFTPGRVRYHTDDSIQVKYYDNQNTWISKAAFSLTGDMGCEHGGGVSCTGNSTHIVNGQTVVWPKQSFLGVMAYNRLWFHKDLYGLTLGGGKINNPGRYLVLLPPINGATAISGTPYFTENPGDPYKAWDVSATFDYMPSQYITFRSEYNHRESSVPYFSCSGGITPPGGNQGAPGSLVPGFTPDLCKHENRMTWAMMVKF
ncbi:MAG TPA: outer membrane beta-barrel protein [Candidatus Angelobacter sp.]|nr:outer membrane beta-barrel protein [Candidatus Angelobacter sp.]